MSDEREPLWSNQRIRDRYHALVPSEANMGEMEYWNVLRDVGERVSYELRNDYEAALANQYQRIERFVELVDQLERKLQEATEANTSCTIYIASQMERIGDLEAQLAQTWQPVNEKFILTYDTGLVDTPKQFVRWNADDESVIVGKDDGSFYHCPLPDNIRLCRLVERAEVQPYSHRNGETEPPTVDGWYWWSGTVIGAYAEKGLVNITVPRNDANIQIWPSWCDGWLGAKDMQGQWYGPIVPPWEVDK